MTEVVLVPLANSGRASSDLPEATKKSCGSVAISRFLC